jgi:hypothetical protein
VQGDQGQCTVSAWSADSRQLAWSDLAGIWVYDVSRNNLRRVVSDTLTITALDGSESPIQVEYSDVNWSPKGRYLSTWISRQKSAARWLAIIDTRLAKVIDIPNSEETIFPGVRATWTQDGDLFVVRPGQDDTLQPAQAELLQVLPARAGYFAVKYRYALNAAGFLEEWAALKPETALTPHFPEQISSNRFSFTLELPDSGLLPILTVLDLRSGNLQRVGPVPEDSRQILWAPDYRRAVIFSEHGALIYMDAQTGSLFDLRSLFGDEVTRFIWLQ